MHAVKKDGIVNKSKGVLSNIKEVSKHPQGGCYYSMFLTSDMTALLTRRLLSQQLAQQPFQL